MVVRMELEVYAELRKEFVKVAKFHLKPAALRQLKIHYEVAINSVRASDYVDTIEDLIRILEKRGVIRYNQIIPLKHIAKTYLSDSVIVEKLNEYESWLKNYDPPYTALTNLYRSNNGECYFRNRNINDITWIKNINRNTPSSTNQHLILTDTTTTDFTVNNDEFSNAKVKKNHYNYNTNINEQDKTPKDYKIRVSHKIYNVGPMEENKVVSEMQIPLNLNLNLSAEHCVSLRSTLEDSDNNDRFANEHLTTTPQSVRVEAVCSPLFNDISHRSLNELSSKENVAINRENWLILTQKKYIQIFFIASILILLVLTLFIVYNLSKNSVQYVPKPTAPSYPEDFHGQPSTSSYSHLESGVSRNQDPYSVGLQKLPKKERELQQRVFQIVSRDLGRFWRDVARYLGVRESDINRIEAQYPDFQQKTYEALKIFAVETDPVRWKPNLKKALSSGRRNDLVEKVDDVLSWPQFN